MRQLKKRKEHNSPFKLFSKRMDSLFDEFFNNTSMSLAEVDFSPNVDLYEDEQNVYIKAELPGMEEKDIDVSIKNNILTISGEKNVENESKSEKEYRIESSYGSFSRSISLPEGISVNKVHASYKKGILKVEIPKDKKKEQEKITINIE